MSNITSSSNVRQVSVKNKLTLTPTPTHGTESKLDAEYAEFSADTSQENKDTDDDVFLVALETMRRQHKEQRAMIVKLQRSNEELAMNLSKREKLIDENREKLTQLEAVLEKKNELKHRYGLIDKWEKYKSISDTNLTNTSKFTFQCDIYQYGVRNYQENDKCIPLDIDIDNDILTIESNNTKPVYLHTRHVFLDDMPLYKYIAKVGTYYHNYLFNGDLVQVNKIHNDNVDSLVLHNNEDTKININFLKQVSFIYGTNDLEKDIFENYYKHLNKNNGFEVEFKSISNDLPDDEFGLFNKNKNKNRDPNVRLNINTRVELYVDNNTSKTEEEILNESYIHANHVLPGTEQACIVTQGPTYDTIVDFWNMILTDRSNLIVMLTDFEEDAEDKCAMYFPLCIEEIHDTKKGIKIECIEMKDMNNWTRRRLRVTRQDIKHDLWHYECYRWPDRGIIKNYSLFTEYLTDIELLRFVESLGQLRPVIHCSAGVGRSGTFVAIIALLKWKEIPHHELNIKGLVELLREQRYGMVQDKDQYKMIYDVLNHFIDTKF
jgi:protein tyrosine phosphatase